jgi:hypothetical protein
MLGIKKSLSGFLAVAVYVSFSLSAVAFDGRSAGEISISGSQDGVSVNGSNVRSGRAIADGSRIVTGPTSSATVSIDGLGVLRVGPNSSFTVNFDEENLSGSLERGEVKVLDAEVKVSVTGASGENFNLGAGESASTGTNQAHDDGTSFASKYWWLWLVIIGGAVTGIVIAASSSNDSPVSPNR